MAVIEGEVVLMDLEDDLMVYTMSISLLMVVMVRLLSKVRKKRGKMGKMVVKTREKVRKRELMM